MKQQPAETILLLALAAVVPLIHLVSLALSPADYSYFIDEFYYIACSKHLAFGYVDHPPLAPLVLALTRHIFGESLLGIRLLPFLAAGATVWLTGRLVQELGGGRFAAMLAALSLGLSPVFIGITGFFSMNAFEPVLWSAVMLALVRLVKTGNRKLWLPVGALMGLAFENKHTIVAYIAALAIGIAIASLIDRMSRAEAPSLRIGQSHAKAWNLRTPWIWIGAAIAIALAVPNIAWQAANGWPSLEFYRNAQTVKNIPATPLQSLMAQVLAMNPVAFPVWVAGLAYLLFARDARHVRFAGLMFLALLAMHVVSQTSRPDRITAAYPIVMAAGGVALERALRRPILRAASLSVVAATGLALAVMFLPVLTPAGEARYVAFLHADIKLERGKASPLPQLMADRTGWRSFIDDVSRVYYGLPAGDRARAIVYVADYGHAGALDLWGPSAGLPRVIASQNTYWHWSDGHTDSDVLIAVGAREDDLQKVFREVRRADTVRCDYCMSWRNNMPIYVAKGPIVPVSSVWARTRFYQ